jgi:uncharacterized protein (UPF0333 family)
MTKNTKIVLGVLAVGAVGYYFYQQSQKPKGFANASGKKMKKKNAVGAVNCKKENTIVVDGTAYCKMRNGNLRMIL